MMVLGRTAKKPAQVLLLPVNRSRWAIANLVRAGSSSGQLVQRRADQAWQGFLSTPCCEQPERVNHEANGFSGTLRSQQHNPLCPQPRSLNSGCLRGCPRRLPPPASPPALSPYGDWLLSLKGVIRKWRAFKNTAIKNNKNNRAGTYVSPQAHHLLLAWIEVFCHQSVTAC